MDNKRIHIAATISGDMATQIKKLKQYNYYDKTYSTLYKDLLSIGLREYAKEKHASTATA